MWYATAQLVGPRTWPRDDLRRKISRRDEMLGAVVSVASSSPSCSDSDSKGTKDESDEGSLV
jgi:hypothetical protein